ncbi:MAG: 6-hydroxymethylpterin diphosphokinase MptE-like protein, partial [Bacillota bacterium]
MTQFAMCRAKNGRPIVRALHPDGRQVLLHSGYDPEREAARLVDSYDLAGAGAVAVLGLGLGYHVGEILRRVDKNTPVAVIEKSPELVVLARKKISFLPWQRLVVLHTEEDIKSFALSSLHVLRGKRLVLVEHPPSVGLDPEFYDRMRARLRDYISFLLVEVNTSRELNRDIQHNLMANLPLVVRDPGIVALKGPFAGRPAVIVAAGPSLARNVHLLHEARDRALLLCVGTAWKVLAKENIQPDLVVTLDPTAENFCHFEGM